MFLLAAHRMSRGYARLRQWLILLFRMLVIAGLILAVGRPLASGWLGLAAGGRADTTIILLDRSPSMQQREAGAGVSKLEAGRRQLADTLTTLGSSRWVLIESATNQPRELPVARRAAGPFLHRADGRRGRSACDARSRARPTSRPTAPGARRSGSARTFEKTTGTPTAAVGGRSARAFWNCRRASVSICWRILK